MATPREQLKNGYDPALGIFRAEGAPEAYKWAVDRLVKEFGWEAVRISVPTDYGRTQMVGILFKDGHGAGIPLKKASVDTLETLFDLNEKPEFLDQFIDQMKVLRDGASS